LGFLCLLIGCTWHCARAQKIPGPAPAANCAELEALNNKVRDGLIKTPEALTQLKTMLSHTARFYTHEGGKTDDQGAWVFPLAGYNAKAIGGKNGNGYIASGYNYFDGNKHGGHPAHDIFINDKDQDGNDDRTKKPVKVVSMTYGIVIATETSWGPASEQRGGNYIWIYVPGKNLLVYYAHNSKVFVSPCNIVNPGDVIAEVGRTGLNAYKKRSPTHLHLMMLKLDDAYFPKPVDCYRDLLRAGK
jgi:murein DD-endopeptidase MepM/ murein hydrolase activator NlpD